MQNATHKRSGLEILMWVILFVMAIAVAVAFVGGFVRTFRSRSTSMEPAIPNGALLLVVRSRTIHRGDIIAFRYPLAPKIYLTKRVVAMGGDTVELRNKQLYLNGKLQSEPYAVHNDPAVYRNSAALPEPYRSRDQFGPYVVPVNSYFVLGDNRDASTDSRYWGCVPANMVVGRARRLGGWWK